MCKNLSRDRIYEEYLVASKSHCLSEKKKKKGQYKILGKSFAHGARHRGSLSGLHSQPFRPVDLRRFWSPFSLVLV